MKSIFKILISFFIVLSLSHAYDINDKVILQKDFENKTIYLPLNNYRTLKFDSRIKEVQLTNSANITADFIDSKDAPLTTIKILGLEIGNESAIVTLESGRTIQINFSIMQNLDSIISIVKLTYPNLIIQQANDTVILKGYVKNYREKDLVIDTFKKAGISVDEKLVDMIETSTPSKMIRVKLYAVEINNDAGTDLKNNWAVGMRNYAANNSGTDYTYFTTSGSGVPSIAQYNGSVTAAMDGIMGSAVTLSGGLSGAANLLSEFFNTSYVLRYLESEGVANILDETTLVTLENKESKFHAGGTIRIKTQTTTAEGLPSTEVEVVKYGLQLEIKAKNVMRDNYVDLELKTSSTQIDWANQVDGIPNFLEKEVITNVMAKNGATIVLGGLINNENSYDIDKVPGLGDIPILGFLFTSKSFKEGKSELVFFITPEIVDPAVNDETAYFKRTKEIMLDTNKFRDEEGNFKSIIKEEDTNPSEKKEVEKKVQIQEEPKKEMKKELSNEERHKQRVNEILGYN